MSKAKGFTLTEMMITVAIVSTMAAIAMPAFQTMITNSRMSTHANDFMATLNLARSEALKRGQAVTVCKSSNGTACSTTSDGWEKGWIIVDSNNVVIRAYSLLNGNDTLTGSANVANNIIFSRDGRATTTGTLTFGLCQGHKKNSIELTTLRARLNKENTC